MQEGTSEKKTEPNQFQNNVGTWIGLAVFNTLALISYHCRLYRVFFPSTVWLLSSQFTLTRMRNTEVKSPRPEYTTNSPRWDPTAAGSQCSMVSDLLYGSIRTVPTRSCMMSVFCLTWRVLTGLSVCHCVLTGLCMCSDWSVTVFRLVCLYFLAGLWLCFDWSVVVFWLVCGCVLTGLWLCSDWSVSIFWLVCG